MPLLAIGRVGWLEVALILGLAAVPVLLALLAALVAKLSSAGPSQD